jgi:tetratricopeptide (TPR) repeat protein
VSPAAYNSGITDPAAKALYAYAEFRLLAVDERWDEAVPALERALAFDAASSYLRLNLARAYLHTHRFEAATEQLGKLTQQDPENIEVRELLGEVYSYREKYPQAIEQFREAIRLDPESESLPVQLALALAQAGERSEAVAILEQLVAAHPESALAQLSLARFYSELGRRDQALAQYQLLVEDNPDLQQAVLEYGQLLESKDPGAAVGMYEEVLDSNPQALEVRRQLVQVYLEQQQIEAALKQLKTLFELDPDDIQTVARIGLLYMELGNWSDAEAAFLKLQQSGKYNQRSFYYLALAQEEQGKQSEAIVNLEQIDEGSSLYTDASLQLIYLYQLNERQDEALDRLEQLVDDDPQNIEAYYYLIALLLDERSLDAALPVARTAIEQNPDSSGLAYQYALLLERNEQRTEAVSWMERVLELDPDHVEALNFLAYHQAENGIDLELALTRVKIALSQQRPGHIVDTLGWIYFKMGRYQDSLKALEEAALLMPEDPYVADHLGDVYSALEMWDAAKEAYMRVRELDGQFEGIEEKLDPLPDGGP